MKILINKIIVFINTLPSLHQICLVTLFTLATLFFLVLTIKANYNPKKLGIKITPIIFTVIFLAITIFIITCL